MAHDLELAARYAVEHNKTYAELTDEEVSLFDFDENGNLVNNTPVTRRLSSIYPRHGERFPQHINNFVYIVQSTEKIITERNGKKTYETYGLFFDRARAQEYIESMNFEDGTVEIIPCPKVDFRKSIWGWDVDGN